MMIIQALQRTAATVLVCQGVELQRLPRPLSLGVRLSSLEFKMAVRRIGSRGITVDGVNYRWRFPPDLTQEQDDYRPGCFVTVQLADILRGSVLVISFPQFRPDAAPDRPAVPVLPSDVARCIRAAVKMGWNATKQGPQFMVKSELVAEPGAAADRGNGEGLPTR